LAAAAYLLPLILLADYNAEGQARLLYQFLAEGGWLELCEVCIATFRAIGLPTDSDDRTVWRTAQRREMVLLTGNRGMSDPDSLEQVIREDNTLRSLPVLIIASMTRLREPLYRERCCLRLVEIALDLEKYRGTGRVFLP